MDEQEKHIKTVVGTTAFYLRQARVLAHDLAEEGLHVDSTMVFSALLSVDNSLSRAMRKDKEDV